jgi:hypothetical protein
MFYVLFELFVTQQQWKLERSLFVFIASIKSREKTWVETKHSWLWEIKNVKNRWESHKNWSCGSGVVVLRRRSNSDLCDWRLLHFSRTCIFSMIWCLLVIQSSISRRVRACTGTLVTRGVGMYHLPTVILPVLMDVPYVSDKLQIRQK